MNIRPDLTKENYHRFVNDFTKAISKNFSDVCFYLYGSYVDGTFIPGSSDIDGGLILNSDAVTPKHKIDLIAEIYKSCLDFNPVNPQFNLLDRQTARDGRFLSYPRKYTDWIKQHGQIAVGPNYTEDFNGLDFKAGELDQITANFRRMRNNLLEASVKMTRGLSDSEGNFEMAIEKAVRNLASLPKSLILLRSGQVNPSKVKASRLIKEMFPSLELSVLMDANSLLRSPKKFYKILEHPRRNLGFYQEVVTQFEQIIQAYIQTFPEVTPDEARG